MTIAYSYTRLSTEKQLRGHGAQRQQEAIEQAAKLHDWTLSDRTFDDFGVSAWKGTNRKSGALRDFIDLANDGAIGTGSVLIVENSDRLSREGVNAAVRLLLELLDLGIKVYTLSDNKIYDGAGTTAMLDLMQWMLGAQRAHEESEIKSKRIRDSRDRAKKAAREEGKPMNRRLPAWLEWGEGRKTIEIRLEIAKVVKRIFQMYAGGMGFKPISVRLNGEGVAYWGRRGTEWTHTVVKNVMKQESVTGLFQPLKREGTKHVPDGEPIDDYYPRIVSQELWATTVNLRASKATSKGRHTESSEMANLFKGILKCSCGSGVSLHSSLNKKNGKRYTNLRCSQLRSGSCHEKNWHYGAFEKIALLGLEKMDWSELLDKSERFNELDDMKKRVEVLKLEQRELGVKTVNLTNAIASRPEIEALLDALDKVEASKKSIDKELSGLEASIASIEVEQQAKNDKLSDIQDVFEQIANEPDARHKANQIINKNLKAIRLGTADSYQTYDKLKGVIDTTTDKRVLPKGMDSMLGYIEIVPKAGEPVRVEVLQGYQRSFIWLTDGKFIELAIEHTKYEMRKRKAKSTEVAQPQKLIQVGEKVINLLDDEGWISSH